MSDFPTHLSDSNEYPVNNGISGMLQAALPSLALVVFVDAETNKVVNYRTQPLHEVAAIIDLLQSSSSTSDSQPNTLEE